MSLSPDSKVASSLDSSPEVSCRRPFVGLGLADLATFEAGGLTGGVDANRLRDAPLDRRTHVDCASAR